MELPDCTWFNSHLRNSNSHRSFEDTGVNYLDCATGNFGGIDLGEGVC